MANLAEDADWAKDWLLTQAFPTWAAAGRSEIGFIDRLDRHAWPVRENLRFRVQARQTYVFAIAGRLGWDGPWRSLVEHGVRFILTRAFSPDGRVFSRYDPDGQPLPGPFDLYDQAFALFGLASGYGVLGWNDCREAALRLLAQLSTRFRNGGGFEEDQPPRLPLRSNPHMHMLEAALAWSEVDDESAWRELANDIDRLARTHFIDSGSGRLLEFFSADWCPAEGQAGRITEPGHQFEWAWLLDRNARLGGNADLGAADRMFQLSCGTGVDRARGVAYNEQWLEGAPKDLQARLWPQTEWLKAAIASARRASSGLERARLEEEARTACRGLRKYLDQPLPGLWADVMLEDGRLVGEASPASSLYHLTCALAELIEFASAP